MGAPCCLEQSTGEGQEPRLSVMGTELSAAWKCARLPQGSLRDSPASLGAGRSKKNGTGLL